MKNRFFLRLGADAPDEVTAYQSLRAAVQGYRDTATELARYGQSLEGSIHLAPSRGTVAEYPDFVLSLGPRGGVRVEGA